MIRKRVKQNKNSGAQPVTDVTPKLPAAVRRMRILDMLRTDGFVSVVKSAQQLGVSQMSVRRDLDLLSKEGSLVRSYGAAYPVDTPWPSDPAQKALDTQELQYQTRRRRQHSAKQAIARSAAALIRPEDSIALDVGSTVLALGREVAKMSGVRVFTNHLRLASMLAGTQCEVLMPGGSVRAQELSLCGQTAMDQIRKHWFSKFFIGLSGLTEEGGFDGSPDDAEVKRAFIERAEQVILLCDSSKFLRKSLAKVCELGRIHMLITNAPPPPVLAHALEDAGVTVRLT